MGTHAPRNKWVCVYRVLQGALLLVLSFQAVQYWPVKVVVKKLESDDSFVIQMPLKDKRALDYFFREVCFLNIWAYTLLGSKPLSVDQYTKPWVALQKGVRSPSLRWDLFDCVKTFNFQEFLYHLRPKELKMKRGWEVLNKYISYFPRTRFLLFTRERTSGEIVDLLLVDKVKTVETIREHYQDFQEVLEALGFTVDSLMEREAMYRFLMEIRHAGLFGTLLGYGRENAWLFFKYQGIDLNQKPMVSAWQEDEIQNLIQLNCKVQSFKPWEISELFYPRFACDPNSEETKLLKKMYGEERDKIVEYFEGKDLVEASLSLFTQS